MIDPITKHLGIDQSIKRPSGPAKTYSAFGNVRHWGFLTNSLIFRKDVHTSKHSHSLASIHPKIAYVDNFTAPKCIANAASIANCYQINLLNTSFSIRIPDLFQASLKQRLIGSLFIKLSECNSILQINLKPTFK